MGVCLSVCSCGRASWAGMFVSYCILTLSLVLLREKAELVRSHSKSSRYL
jgi:hypothetical protein